jgi:predicted nucleic acid-binding protein
VGYIRSGFLDTSALIKSWRKNEEGHNNISECLKICKKENIHLWTSSLVIGEAIKRVQGILISMDECYEQDKIYRPELENSVMNFVEDIIDNGIAITDLQLKDKEYTPKEILYEIANQMEMEDFKKLSNKSPNDILILSTILYQFICFEGPSKPFLISSDDDFCKAINKQGFETYNPTKKSFEDFMRKSKIFNEGVWIV